MMQMLGKEVEVGLPVSQGAPAWVVLFSRGGHNSTGGEMTKHFLTYSALKS